MVKEKIHEFVDMALSFTATYKNRVTGCSRNEPLKEVHIEYADILCVVFVENTTAGDMKKYSAESEKHVECLNRHFLHLRM